MASRNHSSSSYASSEEVQDQRQGDSNEQTQLDFNSNVSSMPFDSDDDLFDQYTLNNFLQILLQDHVNHGSPTWQNFGQETNDEWRPNDKVQVEPFQGGLRQQWTQSSLNQEERDLSEAQGFQQPPRATYSKAECIGSGLQVQSRDAQTFKQCLFQQENEVPFTKIQGKSSVFMQGDQRAKSQQEEAVLPKQWQQSLFQKASELPPCEQPFRKDLACAPPQNQQQRKFMLGEGEATNEWKQCMFAEDRATKDNQQKPHQNNINVSSHAHQTLITQQDPDTLKQQWSYRLPREVNETPAVRLQGNVPEGDKPTYQEIHELSERIDEFLQTWQFLEGQPTTDNTRFVQTSLEQDSNHAWEQQFQQIPEQMLPCSEAQQQSVQFLGQQTPICTWQQPQHQRQPFASEQQENPWSLTQSRWGQSSGASWPQSTSDYSTDLNKIPERQTNQQQTQEGTGYFDRRQSAMSR